MEKRHLIKSVLPGSIARELELAPGDFVLAINGETLEDVFDYEFLMADEEITLLVEKADGEQWELEIEKGRDEDLGIVFETGLMDQYRTCSNNCIFCFIDQMPPGMRETLYFKDDDSRLSFLQGNYITLTNLSERDLERIIRYHLSPINISIHTMNPQLRVKMLHHIRAGEALRKLDRLYEAGITMNGQIVLCKGWNDGEELRYSIQEMMRYLPHLQSVSVVPVGLTKYREKLTPLEPFSAEDAAEVIDLIEKYQKICYEKYGTHFIHASDEWYLNAGREMPEEERYDGYLQLENGVGMVRLQAAEFEAALRERRQGPGKVKPGEVSLVTGLLAGPVLQGLCERAMKIWPQRKIHVYPIRNDFFGERITVAGLLTGRDLLAQLKGKELGSCLLMPDSILRAGEDVFLDDMTREELSKALQVRIITVKLSGYDLLSAILDQ